MDWWQWCEYSPALQWHQQQKRSPFPPLLMAGVVESEQQVWLSYPQVTPLTLANVPLAGLYEGLGIDRALAVLGAGHHYGWPVLVIDAGTALTFSGADEMGFRGGAIAPGLGLQLAMLHRHTAALPQVALPSQLPNRWAQDTDNAILSGVLFNILAVIHDFSQNWLQTYPHSQIVFTGGDGAFVLNMLQQNNQTLQSSSEEWPCKYDKHLIFKGMSQCIEMRC